MNVDPSSETVIGLFIQIDSKVARAPEINPAVRDAFCLAVKRDDAPRLGLRPDGTFEGAASAEEALRVIAEALWLVYGYTVTQPSDVRSEVLR